MARFEKIEIQRCFRLFGKIWTKISPWEAKNAHGETINMHPKRRVLKGVV